MGNYFDHFARICPQDSRISSTHVGGLKLEGSKFPVKMGEEGTRQEKMVAESYTAGTDIHSKTQTRRRIGIMAGTRN